MGQRRHRQPSAVAISRHRQPSALTVSCHSQSSPSAITVICQRQLSPSAVLPTPNLDFNTASDKTHSKRRRDRSMLVKRIVAWGRHGWLAERGSVHDAEWQVCDPSHMPHIPGIWGIIHITGIPMLQQ